MKRLTQKVFNPFRRHPDRVKTKRFMEGWYYRLTLPDERISFAFIFSIEDPNPYKNGELALSAVQVMGPNDEYLVQSDPDHRKFWAWKHSQAFGCTFECNNNAGKIYEFREALTPEEFNNDVKSGFQMLPDRLQGKVDGHDGSLGGVSKGQGVPGACEFDIKIKPLLLKHC